jgi:hypothetical protein
MSRFLQVRSRAQEYKHVRTYKHVMGTATVFSERGRKSAYRLRYKPFKTIGTDRHRAVFINRFSFLNVFVKNPKHSNTCLYAVYLTGCSKEIAYRQ